MAKKITFKDIMGGGWTITQAMNGGMNSVRITAHRRNPVNGEKNTYSEWLTVSYVNRVRREAGFVPIQEHPSWVW